MDGVPPLTADSAAARHVRSRGPRPRYSPSAEDQRPHLGGELGPDLLIASELAQRELAQRELAQRELAQRELAVHPRTGTCTDVHVRLWRTVFV